MSSAQISLGFSFAATHDRETFRPYAEGDIIVAKNGRRHVVTVVSDNIHGVVLCTLALDNGAECVVLEREIHYRTNKA